MPKDDEDFEILASISELVNILFKADSWTDVQTTLLRKIHEFSSYFSRHWEELNFDESDVFSHSYDKLDLVLAYVEGFAGTLTESQKSQEGISVSILRNLVAQLIAKYEAEYWERQTREFENFLKRKRELW